MPNQGVHMASDQQRGIQTIDIGGKILNLINSSNKPLSLSEIAEFMQMSPGYAYKYLISMLRVGLLKRNESTLEFEPGSLCLRLGLAKIIYDPLLEKSRSLLTEFAEKYQINVFASSWSQSSGVTVVFYKEYAGFFNISFRLGTSLSLGRSATGRLFSAYKDQLSLEQYKKLNENNLEFEDANIDSSSVDLSKIRQNGYSMQKDIPTEGISSIAVPVFDNGGHIILGLTAFADTEKFKASENLISELKLISQSLQGVHHG